MAVFTYSDPSLSDLEAVRFYVGDTDVERMEFTNVEVTFLLAQHGSVISAAIAGCRQLAIKYARKADQKVGSLSIDFSQISKAYSDKAKDLEAIESRVAPTPWAGGISIDDKDTRDDDTDRVDPYFVLDQHSYDGQREYPNDRSPW